MSETNPLLNKRSPREEDIYEYEEYDEELSLSPGVKYTLYGLAGFLCVGILYVFTVFLPAYFIPEAVELDDIVKISDLGVELKPLVSTVMFNDVVDSDDFVDELDSDDFDDELDMLEADHITHYEDENAVGGSKNTVERLIMIGDIHGHYIELRHLLRKVKYNKKKDYLLVLGDFVSKGPDSQKVIEFLDKNNIDCILGNHEFYILQNYVKFHGLKFPDFIVGNSTESIPLDIHVSDAFNDDPEFLLAKKLQPEHIRYINKCSLIKKLGQVPVYSKKKSSGIFKHITTTKSSPGIAVHGGLRWDLSLEDQNPIEALEMRSLVGPYFNRSTDDPHEQFSVSWSKVWNKKQKRSSTSSVVYYGHDARRGLNLKPYSRGLDTGCDRGEQLSALVIWNEADATGGIDQIVYKEKVVQVMC
ncbi:metallophosphatase [Yamadazyma tenuis]|uniref:Metallo-dependent phosphatase n=1 Tax=Candida tenuis (strain ATCC 10573 / BCRC 21748 / CBS 615 / JCM 9827 / NBRC 10315 / NRRL Y-1498 / VKM Y-70) TaxID=590646 RepID=G3AXS7_CANTC|nr:Metallo-dependent phosphatase [Yamadazyma tenuis ATCC 10573]XP_006684261.1 uncharacterized protein CANTEDRAFT_112553 [Yamadazyma tenuis ATCC 10573]EGV65686.1 Metallo-dependent phosphatase [Yamadazyma tenuis ATCC 10573]EGV65687.1 hypothetical protein CANTEDRAFT_112553 [Yamadazyma tenuis ATCC 10573]WEJ96000.1 metallophosphatase [Yamadazyma tenuis]